MNSILLAAIVAVNNTMLFIYIVVSLKHMKYLEKQLGEYRNKVLEFAEIAALSLKMNVKSNSKSNNADYNAGKNSDES
jgi:hypothetical protein